MFSVIRWIVQVLEVLDISKDAIWTLVKISAPLMLTSMIVGLVVSLLQAVTQIQEVTLVFVPKILVLFFALLFFAGFVGRSLHTFFIETMNYF